VSDFTRLDELEQLAAFDATVTIQRERSGGITMAIRYKNGGEHIFQSRPTLRDAIDDYIADRRTLIRLLKLINEKPRIVLEQNGIGLPAYVGYYREQRRWLCPGSRGLSVAMGLMKSQARDILTAEILAMVELSNQRAV